MNDFLNHVDQWALGVLMFLYQLMGVQDIPRELDPHWTVVERWAKQPDGSFRLSLESTSVPRFCGSNLARYIVFPQTYEGKQEVFVDEKRIYTNELDSDWHLKSVLGRVIISCDLLKSSKKIVFKSSTLIMYYASINRFPYFLNKYPVDQFLYDLSYIVSATVSLFISFLGTIVLYVMNVKNFKLIGLGFSMSLLMLTHVPGYFLSLHIAIAHVIQMIGSFLIAYFYLLGKIPIFSNKKFKIVYFSIIGISIFASMGHRSTNQLSMLIIAGTTVLTGLMYSVVSKKIRTEVRVNLMVVLSIALFDVYRAQAYREGYANLAGLVIGVVTFEILDLIIEVYKTSINKIKIEGSLDVERKLLQKIKSANEHLSAVIHDLKAPITSLNFLLQADNLDKSRIQLISKRFNSILEKLSVSSQRVTASWQAIEKMLEVIREVCFEMEGLFGKIKLDATGSSAAEVYFFTDDLKNSISEILMNSYKAAQNTNNVSDIKIHIVFLEEEIKIYIKDTSGGVQEDIMKSLTQRGVTTGDSGLGLWMIRSRQEEVGGRVEFKNVDDGFEICLVYLIRS